jgi:hypothetical protein
MNFKLTKGRLVIFKSVPSWLSPGILRLNIILSVSVMIFLGKISI